MEHSGILHGVGQIGNVKEIRRGLDHSQLRLRRAFRMVKRRTIFDIFALLS